MVEAALIMPCVILSIVAIICIVETMFSHVAASSELHYALDDSAGEYSETYDLSPDIEKDYGIGRGLTKVNGECTYRYMTGGMLLKRSKEIKEDSAYVLNEKRHIRVSDHVRD